MSFKEELQEEMKRAKGASGVLQQDPYSRLLATVKIMCILQSRRGRARWEERLTATPKADGTDDDYTLMPDDPDLKEQYLERLRADLPGLDVNLLFGGVYLDVSWE